MLRILIAILACAAFATGAERNTPMEAIAYLSGPVQADGSQVKGNVTFTQNACGENVYVRVYITGLSKGPHGFHVHEKGDQTQGCGSMGGHYNPDKVDHGAPEHEVRHVGDLGNIVADERNICDTTFTDPVISLTGKRTIIGRGLVVHELVDDLGQGNHPDSKKTGNAGARLACGVIGVNPYANRLPYAPIRQDSYDRTFYVPHRQPHDHVVYPLLSSTSYRYPAYPYSYPIAIY